MSTVTFTFGGKTFRCSARVRDHLLWTQAVLTRRMPGAKIVVLQGSYNTGVSASAGTHDYDAVLDVYIPGMGWWGQQRFFRECGWAAWYRYPPKFGDHIHMISLPQRLPADPTADDVRTAYMRHGTRVGTYVPGQVVDYFNHAHGLKGMHSAGSDESWHPEDINKTVYPQKEWTDMATKEEFKQAIREVLTEWLGDDPNDKANKPDIGRARIVHPNNPDRVSSLGHLLFGTDAQIRSINKKLSDG